MTWKTLLDPGDSANHSFKGRQIEEDILCKVVETARSAALLRPGSWRTTGTEPWQQHACDRERAGKRA